MTTYSNLSVVPLDAIWNKKTCDYWYLVQNRHSAHTAFNRRASLLRWLADRGLTINEETLSPHMQGGSFDGPFPTWIRVTGEYRDTAHMSYDAFYSLENVVVETKAMSNGDYTMARITLDPDGIRTVHTLNCNCRFRPTYNHATYRQELG